MTTPSVPEGLEFLRSTDKGENECEKTTDTYLTKAGQKAPKALEKLGTMLSLADRVGSCFWNCPGNKPGLHVIQFLTARTSSYGRAILRLGRFGFYDEALSLVRSLGEIANLIMLFHLDPAARIDWEKSDFNTRRTHFQPGHVRKAIVDRGGTLLMDGDKYSQLCELATHPVPDLSPQNYNPHGIATVGGHFQEAGILLVLNETAVLVAAITTHAARLCDVPLEQRTNIRRECLECIDAF
jgi:hypothetical protein